MIYCCYINNAQKLHLLNKTFHPTKVLLRSESLSSMCAKLHTVAASNNRDHLMRSLRYCLFMPHIYGVILRAHPVHGESHIHAMWITHNANGEVATTSPPLYNEPHWSHVLCVKAQPGTTFASWSQQHFVAIGKPERHVRKASHCGSKQQQRSCDAITLLLLVRTTYIWVLFFAHMPFVVNRTFNGRQKSCKNNMQTQVGDLNNTIFMSQGTSRPRRRL